MAPPRAVLATAAQSTGPAHEELRLVARVGLPVLVTADSSEEREKYGRLIHAGSRCSRGPFVTLSTGSLNQRPTRSDVSADDDAAGDAVIARLEQARGGTLFVDDIAQLNASGQSHLLALLDEHVSPRGSLPSQANRAIRVVAGASRHLDRERLSGAFSQPLFYRLNIIHIDLTRSALKDLQ